MTVILYPSAISMYRKTEHNIVKIESDGYYWILTHLHGKVMTESRNDYPEMRVI